MTTAETVNVAGSMPLPKRCSSQPLWRRSLAPPGPAQLSPGPLRLHLRAGSTSELWKWGNRGTQKEREAEIFFPLPRCELSAPTRTSRSLPPPPPHAKIPTPFRPPLPTRIKAGVKGAGLSILLGYAAAALIKAVGKTVALLLVAAYALTAWLSHKKFLSVDWEGLFRKAGAKATWLLDIDRDGSIGVGDVKAAVNKASRLVGRTKLSSGAAFIVGLAWGLGVLPTPI